ncbi:MAG: TAXI family TRAP transporter solute-binding subunit [Pyramidobacter sp.]
MSKSVKIIVLVLVLGVAGYFVSRMGGNGPKVQQEKTVSTQDKVSLDSQASFTMGTSSSGGTVYAVGAGLSNLLKEKVNGLTIRAVSTGGAVDNIGLLSRKEVQFALNAASVNYQACNGQLPGIEKQDNVRAIASLYPSVIHFLVSKNSGISMLDLNQLKGTKGAVGAAGSASERYSYDILHSIGCDYKERKDIEPVFTSSSNAVDLFKDGHIDWAFFPLGVPGANVTDLCMSGKVNILPIDGELRDKILKAHNYYVPYTIPGGTYKGFDKDIGTLACTIILTCDASVNEDVVYKITKTLWENLDSVTKIANSLKWMSKETAAQGLGAPLHPGAEKYYREVGWIK